MRDFIFKYFLSKVYKLLFSIKVEPKELKIKFDQRCMLLAAKTEDIFLGAGGVLLMNTEKFDVYSLTNGYREVNDENLSYEEKVSSRKKGFETVIEKADITYGEFLEDVDEGKLSLRYDKFQKLSLANFDYIFIPNIFEKDRDSKAIGLFLSELLNIKPYKKKLKIVMYEITSALPLPNCYVDITAAAEKKANILSEFHFVKNLPDAIKNLNAYRGSSIGKDFAEAFCVLSVKDFKKICRYL